VARALPGATATDRRSAILSARATAAGVGFAELAHRNVLRRPFGDAWKRPQFRDGLIETCTAAENCRIGTDRPCERGHRRRPRAGHAERCKVGPRDPGRRWKQMAEALSIPHGNGQQRTMDLYQFAEQLRRGGNGDLLAKNRTHREFEAIPCARHAQSPCG